MIEDADVDQRKHFARSFRNKLVALAGFCDSAAGGVAPEDKVRDFSFKFTILAAVVQSQPPTHLRVTFSDYDDKNAGAYACRRLAIYPVPLASRKLARNPGVNSSERSAQHPRLCPAKLDAARPRATSWRSSSPHRFPSRVNPTKHCLLY